MRNRIEFEKIDDPHETSIMPEAICEATCCAKLAEVLNIGIGWQVR
jgi:hypothetical protein